jgi:hypothetical protein
MKRYKNIFIKTASPVTRGLPASVGPELSSSEINLLSSAPLDPVPAAHDPDGDEIILLEPDTPAEASGDSTPRDDGITFIE